MRLRRISAGRYTMVGIPHARFRRAACRFSLRQRLMSIFKKECFEAVSRFARYALPAAIIAIFRGYLKSVTFYFECHIR